MWQKKKKKKEGKITVVYLVQFSEVSLQIYSNETATASRTKDKILT